MSIKKAKRPAVWYPEPNAVEIGRRLRVLLDGKHMTKADLCRRSGLCYATVDGYVTGRRVPVARSLVAIAQVFGVRIDVLLVGTPQSQWRRLKRES